MPNSSFHYTVFNHYWRVEESGKLYSSARKIYVEPTDSLFSEWVEQGGMVTQIPSEVDLRSVFSKQYPEGWPVDYQKGLISKALSATDIVSSRCYKAGVVFPQNWLDYVNALRLAFSSEVTLEIPSPPLNEDGSVKYPDGT